MLKRCLTYGFQFHGRLHQFTFPILLYSTSHNATTNPLMLNFLIKSIGFSQDEAASIVTNCKVSHRFTSSQNSQLVLDFLKSSGFDDTHIRKIVASHPKVLRSKVDKTLIPKIRFFQELGIFGSDLGVFLAQHPTMLYRSLDAYVVPALDMFKSMIGSNEQLVSLMLKTKSQKLLSGGFLKHFPQNVLFLQSYGVSREKVKWLMLRKPLLLSQRPEWVEKVVKGVEEKLGIPRTSPMFLYGVMSLSNRSDEGFEEWRGVFRSYGWSESEISEFLRRHPCGLNLSVKEVRVKLDYFMEGLGCGSDYLATHPALLSHSLEKKLVPRMAVIRALKDKQLLKRKIGIYTTMCKAESKFVEMFVIPFKDKLPELFEYYTKTTGRSLSTT